MIFQADLRRKMTTVVPGDGDDEGESQNTGHVC